MSEDKEIQKSDENGIPLNEYLDSINNKKTGNPTITIDLDYFKLLLDCLKTQRYLGKIPPHDIDEQEEVQKIIDDAYKKGTFILGVDNTKEFFISHLYQFYKNLWDDQLENIKRYAEEDVKEFVNDENIMFKWSHLVQQEIQMWIDMCCKQWCVIDMDNQKYEVGQIKKDDFDFIVQRRGFTSKMIDVLKNVLVNIGIGNDIK